MKTCSTCGEAKVLTEFHRNGGFTDGRLNHCKLCRQARRAKSTPQAIGIQRNRRLRLQGMKWCASCGTAKPLGEFPNNRAARDGHGTYCGECNSERCRARHAANPEPYRIQALAWAKTHPEEVRLRSRKAASARRARLRNAFVEHVDPTVVFERDEGIRQICLTPIEDNVFDVDHVQPLALGGKHSYVNVRLAHQSCNRQRGRAVALAA